MPTDGSDVFEAACARTVLSGSEQLPAIAALRIGTFNLLAPCYKRLPDTRGPMGRRMREAQFEDLWAARADATMRMLSGLETADVLCLQEFWFENSYQAIARAALSAKYDFHTLQRTGVKKDGVVTLVNRKRVRCVESEALRFHEHGCDHRVALLSVLELRNKPKLRFVLVNTHLTFPHNEADHQTRLREAQVLTIFVERYVYEKQLTNAPIIIAGDMNGEYSDQVCRHFHDCGFREAMFSAEQCRQSSNFDEEHMVPDDSTVNSSDMELDESLTTDVITHITHVGDRTHCDHIWIRAPFATRSTSNAIEFSHGRCVADSRAWTLQATRVRVLPSDTSCFTWPEKYKLSDHRPIMADLEIKHLSKPGRTLSEQNDAIRMCKRVDHIDSDHEEFLSAEHCDG
mmetsp:Transcript_582/g.1535  ORF Transcript_582/g.1535 Transcript_582/m.1535 type:complete len:401 (+) Transcript_582:186-1388(+)